MFNTQRKLDFLKYKEETTELSNNLKLWFSMAEYFEKEYNKDLCNWTVAEIISFCKFVSSSKIKYLTVLVNSLKIYTDWCMANGWVDDNQNHWIEISQRNLYDCLDTERLRRSFISRKDLTEMLPSLRNASDMFLLLGSFEGLTLKELGEAKGSDYADGVLTCKTRSLEISPELTAILAECGTETTYVGYKSKSKAIDLEDSPYVIRTSVEGGKSSNVSVLISSRFRGIAAYLELDPSVTLGSIKESGRFDMIQREMVKNNVTLHEYLANITMRKDMELRYGKIQNYMTFEMTYGEIINKGTI